MDSGARTMEQRLASLEERVNVLEAGADRTRRMDLDEAARVTGLKAKWLGMLCEEGHCQHMQIGGRTLVTLSWVQLACERFTLNAKPISLGGSRAMLGAPQAA